MKRFHCTTCKATRRVRRLPIKIDKDILSETGFPTGRCDWHSSSKSHTSFVQQRREEGAAKTIKTPRTNYDSLAAAV